MLCEHAKPSHVILGPPCLLFNHALERFRWERIPAMVKRHGDSAAIRMEIVLVSARLTVKGKTIPEKGRDDLSRRQAPETTIVDRHR